MRGKLRTSAHTSCRHYHYSIICIFYFSIHIRKIDMIIIHSLKPSACKWWKFPPNSGRHDFSCHRHTIFSLNRIMVYSYNLSFFYDFDQMYIPIICCTVFTDLWLSIQYRIEQKLIITIDSVNWCNPPCTYCLCVFRPCLELYSKPHFL